MNRYSDITAKICNAALVLLTFAALSGCAAIGNPDGGAFDETPPKITNSHPKNGATGYDGRKVTIDFNEFIKLENPRDNVIISPPQIEQPEVKVTGKKIQVELFDSLKPNTTYSIDFSDGIIDNNEGNPLGNYCFRFSTGSAIDTLEVSGYVLNANDLEPIKGITVGLHSDLSDSAFITKPFDRISRTDVSGHFNIRGIAPGKYRIYAITDMDQTFSFSQRNERIAWLDSLIIPTSETAYREDTIFNDDGSVDTTLLVKYTRFMPDDITLLAFTPTPTIQYMSKADRSVHEKFTIQFALPVDSMPKVKGLNFDESDAYILQHSARYDTLTFWMKDTAVYYMDTLKLSITYLATDTSGILVPTTDTLKLTPKRSREKILKEAAKRLEEENKEKEKKLKKLEKAGDSLGIVKLLTPEKQFLKSRLTSGSSMNLYKEISLTFQEPVSFVSDTVIHVRLKQDTLWLDIPYEIEQDTLNILKYVIYAEWRPENTYTITIDSAGIVGLYGLHNDHIKSTLSFSELSRFSKMTVNVANPKPGYTVRILDSKGGVVRSSKLENGTADFFLLDPSTYYVSMFDDVNDNGKWDNGEYSEKRQSEKVWYINRSFVLRPDWEHSVDWNIDDIPLINQKPEALRTQKAKKKQVDIHQKNVERLEKKARNKEDDKQKKQEQREERKERREKNKEKYRNLRAEAKARKEAKKAGLESDTVSVETPDPEEIETPDE